MRRCATRQRREPSPTLPARARGEELEVRSLCSGHDPAQPVRQRDPGEGRREEDEAVALQLRARALAARHELERKVESVGKGLNPLLGRLSSFGETYTVKV